jgi:hypothetical protein
MSKRPTMSSEDRRNTKRKHLSLSIKQKIESLMKLDKGTPVKRLSDEFGVGLSTIHDIKKQKEQLLEANANSDVPCLMAKRKILLSVKDH